MKWTRSLYFWIIIAFISGCTLGVLNPQVALMMEPFGTQFIKLIKIFIGPIVFLTVAVGIAQTGSLKKLGTVGIKAFIYFEVLSTIALLLGWAAGALFKPGSGFNANLETLDTQAAMRFVTTGEELSLVEFLQHLIPTNLIQPFMTNDLLQILFLAILSGVSLLAVGEHYSQSLVDLMDKITKCLFKIIRVILYAAPLGVFGAMSYTIGKFGMVSLIPLLGLVAIFYLTGLFFVLVILGTVARFSGFSIFSFLRYMAPEILLVLGTSSSESALPQLIQKLERLGCQKETVGVVVPLGYSFNLDGTNIYITLAALFIAQALGIQLSFLQQITLFATAMLSSKGAAGVTGAGFITLAATLSVVPSIPAAGIVLILGVDRFMSEVRSLINYIGNGVGALAISRWEKEVTKQKLNKALL